MIILAGIVFTVVVCWVAVMIAGGTLALLARPAVRQLRRLHRRRVTRRLPGDARKGRGDPRKEGERVLPDDWWSDFERQFRSYVRTSERSAGRRRNPHEGA